MTETEKHARLIFELHSPTVIKQADEKAYAYTCGVAILEVAFGIENIAKSDEKFAINRKKIQNVN